MYEIRVKGTETLVGHVKSVSDAKRLCKSVDKLYYVKPKMETLDVDEFIKESRFLATYSKYAQRNAGDWRTCGIYINGYAIRVLHDQVCIGHGSEWRKYSAPPNVTSDMSWDEAYLYLRDFVRKCDAYAAETLKRVKEVFDPIMSNPSTKKMDIRAFVSGCQDLPRDVHANTHPKKIGITVDTGNSYGNTYEYTIDTWNTIDEDIALCETRNGDVYMSQFHYFI